MAINRVTGNPGQFQITAVNHETGWHPCFGLVDDPGFDISIPSSFVGTIALQTSNDDDYTKTRIQTIISYTAALPPRCQPRQAARWFRLICTAYTSGTAFIGITRPRAIGADENASDYGPQTATNGPGTSAF